MKACTKCGVAKAPDDFPVNRKLRDGRDSWCYACRNSVKAEYRKRPEVAKRLREYYEHYDTVGRYANDPTARDRRRQYQRERWADPDRRAEHAALQRERRAASPGSKRDYFERILSRPGVAESLREARRAYSERPDVAERRRSSQRARYGSDPGYAAAMLAKGSARRARLMAAIPVWANLDVVRQFYEAARICSRSTGQVWHVDHVVPLKHRLVCGLHCEFNLQLLPMRDNVAKGNRYWPDMPA